MSLILGHGKLNHVAQASRVWGLQCLPVQEGLSEVNSYVLFHIWI